MKQKQLKGARILTAIAIAVYCAIAAKPSEANTALQALMNQWDQSLAPPTLKLSEVSPSHWAYQAIQSLVQRYPCIVGDSSHSLHSGVPMSRYELAAVIHTCSEVLSNKQNASERIVLQQLHAEFGQELATLQGQVQPILDPHQAADQPHGAAMLTASSKNFAPVSKHEPLVYGYGSAHEFLASFNGAGIPKMSLAPQASPNSPVKGLGGTLNLDSTRSLTLAWEYAGSDISDPMRAATGEALNWVASAQLNNLLVEGGLGYVQLSQSERTASAQGRDGFPAGQITGIYHAEAGYQLPLTQNLSITPGIIWMIHPDPDPSHPNEVVSVIRTTFKF